MFILTWVFIYKMLTNYPKPNYHTQWQQQSKSNRISTNIWGHRKYGKRAEEKKVRLLIESSGTSFAAVWSTVWTALSWVTHRCTDTCCLVFPGSWQIHGVQPWEHRLMLMTLHLDSGWYSGERESACDVYSSFSLSLSKGLFNDLFTQLAHTWL